MGEKERDLVLEAQEFLIRHRHEIDMDNKVRHWYQNVARTSFEYTDRLVEELQEGRKENSNLKTQLLKLKPHQIAELTNSLTAIAKKYNTALQLRSRIARALKNYLGDPNE